MKRLMRPSIGIAGRIVAILLLTLLLEFGVSTLLYERASRFAVREDEAHRLAEHLVISRKLIADEPPEKRADEAAELTTDRYALRWERALPPPPPISPSLDSMRAQILAWEPALERSDLRVQLVSPGRNPYVTGGLKLPDGSWLYFRTIEPLVTVNLAFERILLTLIPAIAMMIVAILLVRRMLFPLRRLAAAADDFGAANVDEVPEAGPGDVRRVTAAFNRMQQRIRRLISDQTQALAAVGHDLRTPLARLKLRADGIQDAALRQAMEGDVAEMSAMVDSLLAFLGGNDDPERPVRIDLAVTAETIVDALCDAGHDVRYEGPDHLELTIKPMSLKRAINNLTGNAVRYGEKVWVRVSQDDGDVTIAVEDDGPGIPERDLSRVLEPFVRLDDARGRDTVGFGLGLPIVVRTLETIGGRLILSNRSPHGLRAAILLPRMTDMNLYEHAGPQQRPAAIS
ncbi:HAMP domain-containing protein [Sphingomonas aliaeris]|uniref:histidine kinase n=2 Tax=Sphingomonas aliaeris TaxID=2759526 RepID=A0A974NWY5_9SPHN|nr:HAMP domain-containing protein [Sphingomonas aliaeris]